MGRGNWLPPEHEVSHAAWIDPDRIYCDEDEEDDDSRRFRFLDAKKRVLACLTDSFITLDKRRWLRNDECVWAENDLAMLVAHEDDYSRLHVALVPKVSEDRDFPTRGLAIRHVNQIADGFLVRLHEAFGEIYLRAGPWTSALYQPKKKEAAA